MMIRDPLYTSIDLQHLNSATREHVQEAIKRVSGNFEDLGWERGDTFEINPTLEIVEDPVQNAFFLIFKDPEDHCIRLERGTDRQLLALKILAESLDPNELATSYGVPLGSLETAIWEAAQQGLVIAPAGKIERPRASYPDHAYTDGLLRPGVFSIQWHITQKCDLNCKHCYDRSERTPLALDHAGHVLEELRHFCWEHRVRGHVCFSGGNPFLYPHFFEVYRLAVEMGFMVSILGNPIPKAWLQELVEIAIPNYYQVSLEGLEEKNDAIRGKGHYRRTLEFLTLLHQLGIDSSVMLTLTNDNIDQVLPLAQVLEDYTGGFTFNRLSAVGQGAALSLPSKEAFWGFLTEYVRAYSRLECVYFKDNLINVILEREGQDLFDGCTGFGCGAAFNFVAVLSDGEIHACRKFPSYIGNIFEDGLKAAYYSESAARYRMRPEGCRTCKLSPACGGCLASSYTFSKDILVSRDPYCPFTDKKNN